MHHFNLMSYFPILDVKLFLASEKQIPTTEIIVLKKLLPKVVFTSL